MNWTAAPRSVPLSILRQLKVCIRDSRYIVERLTRHLQRRSQRAYRPPAGASFYAHLQALGLQRL